jgi:ATP-binding protein involved in chromosome partitioning
MPPGTGDAQLTMAQQVPLKGAVIVSTPQDLALIDARRGIAMFKRVNVPVLGIVENMSWFVDTAGVKHELFGKGGGQAVADFANAPLLAQLPIDQTVREWGDKGTPVVQAAPDSSIGQAFMKLADSVIEVVSARADELGDDAAGPVIDRSGGTGGKRRLPVAK